MSNHTQMVQCKRCASWHKNFIPTDFRNVGTERCVWKCKYCRFDNEISIKEMEKLLGTTALRNDENVK